MSRHKSVAQAIKDTKHTIAKYEAVVKAFPDAKIHETYYPTSFSSKEVNKNYTKLEFSTKYDRLIVIPQYELEFEFEGNTETVNVHSSPKYSRLAYVGWDPHTKKRVIRFSRVSVNLKNNNFKDDMMNDCRIAIMNFIKSNSDLKLDYKHLEPRLKNLLLFT